MEISQGGRIMKDHKRIDGIIINYVLSNTEFSLGYFIVSELIHMIADKVQSLNILGNNSQALTTDLRNFANYVFVKYYNNNDKMKGSGR